MISIIIPTYNERENIVKLVDKVRAVLAKGKFEFEIIIVDDNSPDATAKEINKKFGATKNLRLFVRNTDPGLGSAILFGIKKSRGNVIVGMDADFNHPPEKIPELILALKKVDLSVASRFIRGGGMENKIRYFFTLIFNLFLKHALGFPTMDNMSGFYAVKKTKLIGLPIDKIYRGYGEYHLRLLYLAQKKALKIKEIPVFYKIRQYGQSKTNLFRVFFHYLLIAFELKLSNGRI